MGVEEGSGFSNRVYEDGSSRGANFSPYDPALPNSSREVFLSTTATSAFFARFRNNLRG
jgi:hypothetical protein